MTFIRKSRAPALFLGLSLAGFAAACSVASATADTAARQPLRCEVALDALPGATRIEGVLSTRTATSGSYTMAITSRSAGGTSTILQSGDFTARAGETVRLGETTLSGSPASHRVDLSVTAAGQSLRCADPAL